MRLLFSVSQVSEEVVLVMVIRFALVVARSSCVAVSVPLRPCAFRKLGQATISVERCGSGYIASVLNHTSQCDGQPQIHFAQKQHGDNVRGTGSG